MAFHNIDLDLIKTRLGLKTFTFMQKKDIINFGDQSKTGKWLTGKVLETWMSSIGKD